MRTAVLFVVAACGRLDFDPAQTASDNTGDAYADALAADGPIAYWRFNERTGTTVTDEVSGVAATLSGGCTLGVVGALTDGSPGVQLDGRTCRIVASDVVDFAGTAPFSIEVWARIDVATTSTRWFVSHATPIQPNVGWSFAFQDSVLWFEQNDGVGGTYTQTPLPALHQFHHLAFTSEPGTQRLYVDGAIALERTFNFSQPVFAAPLVFGDYLEPNPNKFEGTLDEAAFYDRVLTPAQIAAHIAAR